ncbi:conserved Plasmodium protein, unknown function [Plasmodium vinckei brucechwatti]|uniref:Uncharacterized protein n=1 Tax=Plasmodium vinckei brucechwatti TaxID=119398 RepID=A0A6V7SP14_PLAVN|nr:conserved Plasmodium protein, unknown function [Plasmodium vinckei brucechwatti]
MSHLEFLHKFVISHSNNFLQSFYAVVESSQIECLECPIEKTGIDNFLIKIYIDNIIHNIRTLLLTCLSGSIGNTLHNTEIEKNDEYIYVTYSENKNEDSIDYNSEDSNNIKNDNNAYTKNSYFLNKCKNIHNLRKSLENAKIKTSKHAHIQNNILSYCI